MLRTAAKMINKPIEDLMFPNIEPLVTSFLKVSDIHTLYYEVSGNPVGNPVLYVHGGPGGGTSSHDRRYFDPAVYKIIIFDQRGCGKSTPFACLDDNTTWDLVSDIEKLREHLCIDKWVVFGGSWGSTLSLTYAETHSDRVKALILRGIFTLRRKELEWFYQEGASFMFPDEYERYISVIPPAERFDLMSAYHRRLTCGDREQELRAAKAWSRWECATSRLFVDQEYLDKSERDDWALAFARIECHYFVHGGFFREDGQILKDVDRIKDIPGTIVQGRYDLVCPPDTAWALHKAWPKADFNWTVDGGHSAKEYGTTKKLIEATNKYKHL